MILPPTARVRIEVPTERENASRCRVIARAVCDERFGASARAIKSDDRSAVLAGEAAGYEVVVKTLALDRAKDRLRAALRLSRHWRQARGSEKVRRAGADACPVLAIARGIDPSGHRVEALIMDRVDGPTLLRAAADRALSPTHQRMLLDRVGAAVGQLARSGIFNRDHKPSNLIVTRDEAGEPMPVLIDCADIRRAANGRALVGMLSKLLIEANGTEVSVGVGEQVRVAQAARREAGLDAPLRELVAQVHRTIEAHGDPRPKVDPLAFDG